MRTNLILRAAALAVLGFASAQLSAASFTWDGDGAGGGSTGGTGPWDISTPNWFDGVNYVVWPNGSPNADKAIFPAVGGTVTLGAGILANALQFDAGGYTISNGGVTANKLTISGTTPTITVSNAGEIAVVSAEIAGAGLVKTGAGTLQLTAATNSWTGGLTINGGVVEAVSPDAVSMNLPTTGANLIGNGGNINLNNGGELKLTVTGATATVFTANGASRPIVFGSTGGTLNVNARMRANAANFFSITTSNTAGAAPAVIKFTGGSTPWSNNTPDSGWNNAVNALRLSMTNNGPVRAELPTGAMVVMPNVVTLTNAFTVRGVPGGDPTSGPAGTVHPGVSLLTGRLDLPNQAIYNVPGGLFLEDAMQVSIEGAARLIDGNVTIRGSAGGHAGYVAFAGRGTGTGFGTGGLNLPGASGVNINPLWIGSGGNDLLTIEDGGTAVLDLRFRSDQVFNHPVLLNSKSVINAGGTLAFKQSISNFSPIGAPVQSTTVPNGVGYHIVQGLIEGQGNSVKDSVIDISLPFDNVVTDNQPLGGVEFQANTKLIVNGTGTGGLLVRGTARPNALFSGGTPDPVSNADKVANLLSQFRLAGITGTGGYVTPSPMGVIFNFPSGGDWSPNVPVGLKIINSNVGGVDVGLTSNFVHSVLVDAGAELSTTGNSLGGPGAVISGTGTISGGFTLASGATLSTGSSPGTLTSIGNTILADGSTDFVELGGTVAGSTYDQLDVTGTVALNSGGGGSILYVKLAFDPAPLSSFTIIKNDDVDPVAGIFSGMPEGATFTTTNSGSGNTFALQISYQGGDGGPGNDVVLTVVPEPASMALVAMGAMGLLIRRRRTR